MSTPRKTPQDRKPRATKPKPEQRTYTVVDDVLHYTTKAGHSLSINLDLPPQFIRNAMEGEKGDRPDEEQFEDVRGLFGDGFDDAWAAMGIIEQKRVVRAFFDAFAKAAGIPLGEASSSSGS